jgi:hypothetical protein
MRRDDATPQLGSTKQQSASPAPPGSRPAQQSSGSVQLTGNQRLERRKSPRETSPGRVRLNSICALLPTRRWHSTISRGNG